MAPPCSHHTPGCAEGYQRRHRGPAQCLEPDWPTASLTPPSHLCWAGAQRLLGGHCNCAGRLGCGQCVPAGGGITAHNQTIRVEMMASISCISLVNGRGSGGHCDVTAPRMQGNRDGSSCAIYGFQDANFSKLNAGDKEEADFLCVCLCPAGFHGQQNQRRKNQSETGISSI